MKTKTIRLNGTHPFSVAVADGFFPRFRGLMGVSPIQRGLLLSPCGDIHTFFMKEPIDVLFLDQGGRVLKRMDSMPPWRMSGAVKGAKMVLELPAGALRGFAGETIAFADMDC